MDWIDVYILLRKSRDFITKASLTDTQGIASVERGAAQDTFHSLQLTVVIYDLLKLALD